MRTSCIVMPELPGDGRGPPDSGPFERRTIYGQLRAFGHTGVASDRPSGTGPVAPTV
jgi:hypothetical protein